MHISQHAVLDFTYGFYANCAAADAEGGELNVAQDALSVSDPKVKNADLAA